MTTLADVGTADVTLSHRHLVDPELWDRMVARITKDEDIEPDTAARIMDQAIGFLRLCAADPTGGYNPSPLVDIGWHTFILYTGPYADFCARTAGRFIHHAPTDVPGDSDVGVGVADTIAAMQDLGLAVDPALWTNAQECRPGKCQPQCNPKCRTTAPTAAA